MLCDSYIMCNQHELVLRYKAYDNYISLGQQSCGGNMVHFSSDKQTTVERQSESDTFADVRN